jgi:starvation-inducible DNA-binding protein
MALTTKQRTFETLIDVREPVRDSLIALLNERLADLVDLSNQTKYAHWNVKGPDFSQLHVLFDEVAGRAQAATDLVAERVTTLGGVAMGTTRQSAAASTIGEYDLAASSGIEHLRSLSTQVAKLAASIRKAISESDKLGDPTTADLFTEVSRALDKDLWLLESHLQTNQ